MRFCFLASLLLILSNQAFAATGYTLFNLTPDAKLRPLSTERSSKSDFVTTVDPGRLQLETSLVSVVKNKNCDNGKCSKTSSATLGDTNSLRLGLTENTEFHLLTNLYTRKKSSAVDGNVRKKDGFGDTFLRFKYSFSGNRGEKFGIAASPFIKLPTNQDHLGNNHVEGGVIIPFAVTLTDKWLLGGMSQFNFLRSDASQISWQISGRSHRYVGYINAIYVTRNFTERLYAFAEYYTYKADIANSWWQNTVDFGLHYLISKNFKIDCGVNLGVTNAADDANYYTGFAYRF